MQHDSGFRRAPKNHDASREEKSGFAKSDGFGLQVVGLMIVTASVTWFAAPALIAWSAAPTSTPEQDAALEASVFYPGCNEVRAAGKAPLYRGQPGYRTDMDGDADGIACEPHP